MAQGTWTDRHFHLGSAVQCRDGRAGTLYGLAVNETSLTATHLVVQRGALRHDATGVPMDRVIVPLGEHVLLGLTAAELERTTAVPEGVGQLSRASWIECEGEQVGILDCVLIDPETHRVTYLIVRRGILLSRDICIPAPWIQRIQGRRVILSATRRALGRLRRFDTHRDAAHCAQTERYEAGA